MLLVGLASLAQPLVSTADIQPRIVGGVESAEDSWPFMTALMYKNLGISVEEESVTAYFLVGSAVQLFSGKLVDCGKALTTCEGAEEKICLIERGKTPFSMKANNCQESGGVGAIIYNNVAGEFLGDLGGRGPDIPIVSVSRSDGLLLLNYLDSEADFGYLDSIPSSSYCGATYIGGKWLVTAAHCVLDVAEDAILANVGGHDLLTDRDNVIAISRIIRHESYDPELLTNDIALIELVEEPVGVDAISMASEDILEDAIAEQAKVIELGRGQQEPVAALDFPPVKRTPAELFEVEVNLVPNEPCNSAFNDYFVSVGGDPSNQVKNDMLCAGTEQGDAGTCFGDSGGPLILQHDDQDYLIGITSWGLGCAVEDLYDVFARIPYFETAIEKVMSGETHLLENEESSGKNGFFFLSTSWELLFISLLLYRRNYFTKNK